MAISVSYGIAFANLSPILLPNIYFLNNDLKVIFMGCIRELSLIKRSLKEQLLKRKKNKKMDQMNNPEN